MSNPLESLPPDLRVPALDPEYRLPQVVVDRFKTEHMPEVDVDEIGLVRAVIVSNDEDVADIPDGTFIARLPQGFQP